MYAKRTDANHLEIKKALQKLGFKVFDAKDTGEGFPDLVLGRGGHTWLVEVKTLTGKLNKAQMKFHEEWTGSPVAIIRTIDEAISFSQRVP